MNGASAFQEKKRQDGKHMLSYPSFLFCFQNWKREMTAYAWSVLPRSLRPSRGSMLPVPGWSVLSSDPGQRDGEEQASLALPGQVRAREARRPTAASEVTPSRTGNLLAFLEGERAPRSFDLLRHPNVSAAKEMEERKRRKECWLKVKMNMVSISPFSFHTSMYVFVGRTCIQLFSRLKGTFLSVRWVFAMNDPPT